MKLLEYENKGLVLDLGFQHKYKFSGSFIEYSSVGFLIKNLNTGFKDNDQIPQIAVIGSSKKIRNLPFVIDFKH